MFRNTRHLEGKEVRTPAAAGVAPSSRQQTTDASFLPPHAAPTSFVSALGRSGELWREQWSGRHAATIFERPSPDGVAVVADAPASPGEQLSTSASHTSGAGGLSSALRRSLRPTTCAVTSPQERHGDDTVSLLHRRNPTVVTTRLTSARSRCVGGWRRVEA